MQLCVGATLALHLLILGVTHAQSPCTTPNRDTGLCINLRSCRPLYDALQQQTPGHIELLQRSHCGFSGRDPLVCCPQNINFTPPPPNNNNWGNTDPRNHPLLPSDCGQDLSSRIIGGEITELDEFPWMALLEYRKPNGLSTGCGGVLISKRYVMTAAHCIKGRTLPKSWRLSSVRLGEYDTDTTTDCIPDGNNGMTCADDPLSVGIEDTIVHEQYDPFSNDQSNDIALLRLNRDVPFTHFIKPICLPSHGNLAQKLHTAGWGRTEERIESNIKLKVSLPLVDKSVCQSRYGNSGIQLGQGQICAGGQRGKDSCRGDSGGPLMSVEKTPGAREMRWTAVGVVSFGPSPCGMPGWPGVYTKVHEYMGWVLSKLRA